MNKREKKLIAKYATFEDCKLMLHNARQSKDIDWHKPCDKNPIMTIGKAFNIFAGSLLEMEKEYSQPIMNITIAENMCDIFGDYMIINEKMQEVLNKYRKNNKSNQEIPDKVYHEDPIEF